MAIPQNLIDQIQDRTDIVEVISRYMQLKKAGRNYRALCPFHHEKTPSFMVNPDKQIYHCFGCGVGGNVFSFLMRYENIQFPEAVEILAEKTGVELPKFTPQRQMMSSLSNQLYKMNELACGFFQASLVNNSRAKDYLNSRGIGDGVIKDFRIGFAPDTWDGLITFFKKKGFEGSMLEKAGLSVPSEKGGHYDMFRARITFPIFDLKERILGFGGRVLDAGLPKYINSPETCVYSKGRNLYGLNFSKEHIKKEGHVLVVEGYLDFIIPYQAGIKNLVATLGTALTIDQVKMLKRFTQTAIMVYDPDEAGEAASLRNLDLFIMEDVNVYIAEIPKGFDPDSHIRKFGREEFTRIIKSSKNIFDYKLEKLASRFDMKSPHGKAAIAGEILPTISKINNAVFKSDLIKRLAERLSVDEESLKLELKKVKPDYLERRYIMDVRDPKRACAKKSEEMILALMLEGESFISRVLEALQPDEFKTGSIRDAVKAVFDLYRSKVKVTPARLISYLENNEEAAMLISDAVTLGGMVVERERALADCINRIKEDDVKERLQNLQLAIKSAHDSKDEAGMKRLILEYNDLVKSSKT